MENNFLGSTTPGMATSNPQNNVNQLNRQISTSNVAENPANTNMSNAEQQINPITIPIQIQPQIATNNQSNNTPRNANLQVNNQNTSNVPTPQTYQNNSTANKVVDFNQIYKNYNQAVNNNVNSTSSSGIRKTSYNTTIVTPTVSNLNSVEGQYQSAYADTINGLIGEMLSQMKTGFQYDPTQDNGLKMATEYASNSTLQSLAGSGVLNSSATSERVARIVSELIPQYEEKAHNRWIEYLGQLADTAQLVMNYDSQQFEYWKDAKDREFENKQFEYQKRQDALENAWKRVDELGFVDNEASAILGVKVGTLSGQARLAKEQQEFELAKMREQAQIEYANNVALYKLKSELDLEQSKALASYNSELSKKEMDYEYNLKNNQAKYEYELASKYGGNSTSSKSTSNTTSLSTYKDIINNRYANYDDISRKYTVSNNAGLWDYLTNEYVLGRMSENDYASLISMYGVTEPTDKDRAKQERIKYLESLGIGGIK